MTLWYTGEGAKPWHLLSGGVFLAAYASYQEASPFCAGQGEVRRYDSFGNFVNGILIPKPPLGSLRILPVR